MVTPPTHLSLISREAPDKSTPRRVSFDTLTLKSLQCPPARLDSQGRAAIDQKTVWDRTTPGFGLRLSSSGAKVWVWMGRIGRDGQMKAVRYHLGDYTERDTPGKLTLRQAREKASAYHQAAAGGQDPGQAIRKAKHEAVEQSAHTFGSVVARFLQEYRPATRAHLSPKTIRRNTGLLTGPDVQAWASRPLASLTKQDVIVVLDAMQRRGLTRSVNLMVSTLKVLFGWARDRGLLTTSPVVELGKRMAEPPRERHLFGDRDAGIPSEIPLLWKACERSGRAGVFAKLLLLTGARRDEVANLRWGEVLDLDGESPRWHLSTERTKTRRSHTLPLPPLAVSLMRELKREQEAGQTPQGQRIPPDYPYVFYAAGTKRDLGFSFMKRTLDKQIAALKAQHPARDRHQFETPWRFHDLRRTVETGLCGLGVSREVRDSVANHAPDKIQATYNQSGHVPQKREALSLWEAHIVALLRDEAQARTTRTTRRRRAAERA